MKNRYFIILSIIFSLLSCSDKNSVTNKAASEAGTNNNSEVLEIPDVEIYDFSIKHSVKDKLIWELVAKEALRFENKNIMKTGDFKLSFYEDNSIDTVITAKYGERKEDIKILTAITNVVLTTADGTVLKTEILNYDEKSKLLYTDKFVLITKKNGDIIKGRYGMKAYQDLEELIIFGGSGQTYDK